LGQLIVRNLGDDVILVLKRRAARHGRSSEAEHRAILSEVLAAERARPSFNAFLASTSDVGEDANGDGDAKGGSAEDTNGLGCGGVGGRCPRVVAGLEPR
jgi:plasmid stability protein